jgi:hypothetical protein
MVMSPVGLGTKNHCTGDNQQHLTVSASVQPGAILEYEVLKPFESGGLWKQELLYWRGSAGIYDTLAVQGVLSCTTSSRYLAATSDQRENFMCAVVVMIYKVCK